MKTKSDMGNHITGICEPAKPSSLHRRGSTATNDIRSPLAKARDKWLASEEGQKLCDHAILRDPTHKQYLENRIELAFLAGVAVAQKLKL